jgi:hypothetical protein
MANVSLFFFILFSLFHEYKSNITKQIQVFMQNYKKTANFVMELELHQYAILGFIKTIHSLSGNTSLVNHISENTNLHRYKSALLEMLPDEHIVFINRYGYQSLHKIKNVYRICRVVQMSDENYRKKMNVLKKYIVWRIRKAIF